MELPISIFWTLVRNISRLRAENLKHEYTMMMHVLSCALGGADPKVFMNSLNQQMDNPIKVKEKVKFDKDGFNRLKQLVMG
jgi:hypothetical protein